VRLFLGLKICSWLRILLGFLDNSVNKERAISS
jgi:hypothetical protein